MDDVQKTTICERCGIDLDSGADCGAEPYPCLGSESEMDAEDAARKPLHQSTIEATAEDRAALVRTDECWDDGEGTDVGRPALARLEELGWIEKVGRRRWQISPEGFAVLEQMRVAADD